MNLEWYNGYMSVRLYLILSFVFILGWGMGCRPEASQPVGLPTLAPTAVLFTDESLPRPPTPPVTPAWALPDLPSTITSTSSVQVVPSTLDSAALRWRVGATTAVPAELQQQAQALTAAHAHRFQWVAQEEADVWLDLGGAQPLARWLYVVAAPFNTIQDSVTLAEVQAAWQTQTPPLLVEAETAVWLAKRWGNGLETTTSAGLVPAVAPNLVETVWQAAPAWTILPFHHLQPRLKVLMLDEANPLSPDFAAGSYPLWASYGLSGEAEAVAAFQSVWTQPASNYRPDEITRIAMTGVTALVRATAYQMEINGIDYPGSGVAPILQAADIAHISNEVSFSPDCPYPNPVGGTTFCSRPQYFDLLTGLGIDVVELTGNHLNDYGADKLLYTLELYEEAGMATFGGGRDMAHAAEPALFTHNGNHIAFVGCNPVGPAYAWATETRAGARPCDENFEAQIGQLAAEGYLVMATLQYHEFYHYAATPQQKADFLALVEAGATAVSGSQAHHAQGFALPHAYPDRFIHYGPGNLFFDQMHMLGTRQAFVATYVVLNGRLLSVELWTGLIENYARPRPMTADERAAALRAVFQASDWE
jgi:hypothetical protein